MFRFSSFDVDAPTCRIFFGFVDTDGGVQLFSRTSATKSSKMLFNPTWAVLCSWSVLKIVLYYLDLDLFEACLILILDVLSLPMVVDYSDTRGPNALARHSCSNAGFLHYPDDSTDHSDVHQCMHVTLLEALPLYQDSSALAGSKPLELQAESALD